MNKYASKITFVKTKIKNKEVKIVWNTKSLRSVGTYIDGETRPFLFTSSRVELGPYTAYDIALSQLKTAEELILI
jgi:hypothetical protein